MKHALLAVAYAVSLGFALAGCGVFGPINGETPPSNPVQQSIDALYNSSATLDQAILAADAAVKAGKLKGNDARNAGTAFKASKAGLDAALVALKASTAAPAPAASGATK